VSSDVLPPPALRLTPLPALGGGASGGGVVVVVVLSVATPPLTDKQSSGLFFIGVDCKICATYKSIENQ